MARLTKEVLRARVVAALDQSGWTVTRVGNGHPFEMTARMPDGEDHQLRVYAWNISHGGATRSPDEFRIQITGVAALEIDEGHETVLLGIDEEEDRRETTLIAYDPRLHATFGSSPSIQVHRQTIDQGSRDGFAFEQKELADGNAEVVVAMRSENFGQYISNILPEYHQGGRSTQIAEAQQIETISFDQPQLTDEQLAEVSADRRRALRKTAAWVRDQNFRRRVCHVYRSRCAMCGLQANLVQASHIVAVCDEGPDLLRNGVALCPNHHDAYDRGLLAIGGDYIVRRNDSMVGALRDAGLDQGLNELLDAARVGERIYLPAERQHRPYPDLLEQNLDSKGRQNFS